MQAQPHPHRSALLELGLFFLPALPAYLWIWPNINGLANDIFQVFVYSYILAGTLFIGLRRWNWDQLGVNRKGLGLVLACGLAILAARFMIVQSIHWNISPPQLTVLRLLGSLVYYFGLVGLVEELLFRGLIYRLLEDWRGTRWAIWGSSIGFGLWHVFGQGLLLGAAGVAIGLLFALLRWRAGGILGLIILHALWDIETVVLVSGSNAEILDEIKNISFTNLALVWIGTLLLFGVPLYVWLLHPRLERWLRLK